VFPFPEQMGAPDVSYWLPKLSLEIEDIYIKQILRPTLVLSYFH